MDDLRNDIILVSGCLSKAIFLGIKLAILFGLGLGGIPSG